MTKVMEMEAVVLTEVVDGVATVTLNRPKQFNALSEETLAALQAALDGIAADESVRVVVLAANGKAFCAGHDLKHMRANPQEEYYTDLFNQCSRMMLTINQMPQPVIASCPRRGFSPGCCAADRSRLAPTYQSREIFLWIRGSLR
jgi:enoyl-CoA hydratase/carnithine racemase